MKKTPLKRISDKRATQLRHRRQLVNYLANYRAFWHCEICDKYIPYLASKTQPFGLHGAHITELSQGGKDTKEDIIIACNKCHDHSQYSDAGLVCGEEKAREIVKERNEKYL